MSAGLTTKKKQGVDHTSTPRAGPTRENCELSCECAGVAEIRGAEHGDKGSRSTESLSQKAFE